MAFIRLTKKNVDIESSAHTNVVVNLDHIVLIENQRYGKNRTGCDIHLIVSKHIDGYFTCIESMDEVCHRIEVILHQ